MKTNFSSWNTHDWISSSLELVPGHPLIQQTCRECGRTFVDEFSTGARFAVHLSIFMIHRLSDEVTADWLSQNCPDERLMADKAARQTRFLNEPSRSGAARMANDASNLGSLPNRKTN